ncbi:unnamed protein product [Fraxinus pennsylvanica]|uniref:DUF4094 domain-containing protein n=1 Tax=Fraxinus pennsylvanica TaxID=56036 RepID=A0AAD2DK93_9LAMI|nr:unnamed protein product [Fraxinus pennsylvanica]
MPFSVTAELTADSGCGQDDCVPWYRSVAPIHYPVCIVCSMEAFSILECWLSLGRKRMILQKLRNSPSLFINYVVFEINSFYVSIINFIKMCTMPEAKDTLRPIEVADDKLVVSDGRNPRSVSPDNFKKDVKRQPKDILGEVSKTHDAIQTLDKTISNLEMELATATAGQNSLLSGAPISAIVVAKNTGDHITRYFPQLDNKKLEALPNGKGRRPVMQRFSS